MSETTWPIKAKNYVEHPWEKGMNVCINSQGLMTKMAAMAIKFFYRIRRPMILKLGMKHQAMVLYKVYINHDPGMTLNFFTARST